MLTWIILSVLNFNMDVHPNPFFDSSLSDSRFVFERNVRYQTLGPVRLAETWLKLAEKHCSD